MPFYSTVEGDVLDGILAAHYGADQAAFMLPLVLVANPRLSSLPLVLPRGLTLFLPALEEAGGAVASGTATAPRAGIVRLWGTT
jgi:phage tail protein X